MRRLLALNFIALAIAVAIVAGCTTPGSSKRNPADDHAAMNMTVLQPATLDQCNAHGPMTASASPEQATAVYNVIGDRGNRLQHALWHAARSGLTKKIDSEVLKAFGPDWTPATSETPATLHAFCEPSPPARDWNASDYNPVGEDFLYMHRKMVGMVRGALLKAGLPCLAPWNSVQDAQNDTANPIPGGVEAKGPKSDETLQLLLNWDQYFQGKEVNTGCPPGKTSCSWLETVSLSQLGMALELSVHNNLHMRYATDTPPAQFKATGAPIPYNNAFPANWAYDQQAYDWLADPYGAAVNPIFWKIHGYVDSLINKWLSANGFTTIAEDCTGQGTTCYQWHGTWAPGMNGANTTQEQEVALALAAPAEEQTDPQTDSFNHSRMLMQWSGVRGGPKLNETPAATPSRKPRSGKRVSLGADAPPVETAPATIETAPTSTVPTDPFQYAVQAECKTAAAK